MKLVIMLYSHMVIQNNVKYTISYKPIEGYCTVIPTAYYKPLAIGIDVYKRQVYQRTAVLFANLFRLNMYPNYMSVTVLFSKVEFGNGVIFYSFLYI